MIQFSFDEWKLKRTSLSAQQYDDKTIQVLITGDLPDEYSEWTLKIKAGSNYDEIPLDQTLTGYSCTLDKQHLGYSGSYKFQLMGSYESGGESYSRNTNKEELFIESSLDSDAEWSPLPTAFSTALASKVDKVTGKGLSTNDYTDADKTKVANAITEHQSLAAYRTASAQDIIDATKIGDAPSDNKQYARKNGNWEEVQGGGGTSDFDTLTNRPKYNGSAMTHSTDIPEVKTSTWDGKANALVSIEILPAQITSEDPLTIQFTTAQMALIEDGKNSAFNISIGGDYQYMSGIYRKSYGTPRVSEYSYALETSDKEAVLWFEINSSGLANAGYTPYENVLNKVTSVDEDSTDDEYPSAKCVYDDLEFVKGEIDAVDSSKADKVTSATNGHFAGLDANGNLTDSGVSEDDLYKSGSVWIEASMVVAHEGRNYTFNFSAEQIAELNNDLVWFDISELNITHDGSVIGSFIGKYQYVDDGVYFVSYGYGYSFILYPEVSTTVKMTYVDSVTDISGKQNITDNSLTTTAKTVVGAINELDTQLDTKVNYTDKLSQLTGTMSDTEKSTTWSRLNSIKTSMDAVAVAGAQYYLGEQTAVAIVLPSSGMLTGQQISVVFYSGSTAATLSITGTTIGDIPTPTTNQRIEVNMLWDGTYWAIVSNVMAVTV